MRKKDYTDIRYYPVIDCDTTGEVKVPMVPTLRVDDVRNNHNLWLREMVPNVFRLCSTDEGVERLNIPFNINCPLCGDALHMIAKGTSKNIHGLYECRSCKR